MQIAPTAFGARRSASAALQVGGRRFVATPSSAFARPAQLHSFHSPSALARIARCKPTLPSSARTAGSHNGSKLRYSSSSVGKVIRDAEHPNGLYYHPINKESQGTRYAVSYFANAPSSSAGILAHIDVPTASANDPGQYAREHPDEVEANREFWDLLHHTLREDIVRTGKDEILVQEADLRGDGWAHLNDQRQLLMPGRIPLPDAIIASVSFSDCKIVPESYEVNGTYRPITREEGFTVLRDTWLEAFKAAVAKKS